MKLPVITFRLKKRDSDLIKAIENIEEGDLSNLARKGLRLALEDSKKSKYEKLVVLQDLVKGYECQLEHYQKMIDAAKKNKFDSEIVNRLKEGMKGTQGNLDKARELLSEFIEENL